jgi:hypothetical protein
MSEKQFMSVTRALALLKQTDERIQRAISDKFIDVSVGKGNNRRVQRGGSDTVEVVEKNIQSSIDSVRDLMSRRAVIKAAIVASNAQTRLTIGGKYVTVAEAIEMKRSVELKRQLVSVMKTQYLQANNLVASLNVKVEASIDAIINTMMASDKSAKVDPSVLVAIGEPQRNQSEAGLIDPANLSTFIKNLEDEISEIDTELDFLLSEINAKTEILV